MFSCQNGGFLTFFIHHASSAEPAWVCRISAQHTKHGRLLCKLHDKFTMITQNQSSFSDSFLSL
jgi:hypothetical protein